MHPGTWYKLNEDLYSNLLLKSNAFCKGLPLGFTLSKQRTPLPAKLREHEIITDRLTYAAAEVQCVPSMQDSEIRSQMSEVRCKKSEVRLSVLCLLFSVLCPLSFVLSKSANREKRL